MFAPGGEVGAGIVKYPDVVHICFIPHIWVTGADLPGAGLYYEFQEAFAQE
jgi:hypothetical protein